MKKTALILTLALSGSAFAQSGAPSMGYAQDAGKAWIGAPFVNQPNGLAKLDAQGTLSQVQLVPGMTAGQLAYAASKAVQQEQIGTATSTVNGITTLGVAPLDGNGTLSAVPVAQGLTGAQVQTSLSGNATAIGSETTRALMAEGALGTSVNARVPLSSVGAANGVASTDSSNNVFIPNGKAVSFNSTALVSWNGQDYQFTYPTSSPVTLGGINATAQGAIYGGMDPVSPVEASPTKSIEAFNPADQFLGRQFTQWGGHSANDIAAIKAKCQTISGGDQGGVCFQFVNGYGPEGWHRSGSGLTDSVNVEMDTQSSPPLDHIGGGTASSDGVTYSIVFTSGNKVTITPALSAKEQAYLRSRVSIFTNVANGMYTKENTDYSGTDNVDLPNYYYGYLSGITNNGTSSTTLTIENYYYQGATAPGAFLQSYSWRTIAYANPYPFPWQPSWTQTAAASVASGANTLTISGYLQPSGYVTGSGNACTVWTCYISGAGIASGTTITATNFVNGNTTFTLSKALTGAVSSGETITFTSQDQSGGTNFMPNNMPGDSLDNQIPGNTNSHAYTSPALFIGMTIKDFNEYHLQNDSQPSDTITRAHDNEEDFWMNGATHDGQLLSRGRTMVWQGQYKLATGSWMQRWAGFNLMPTGLYVDGVMNGGLEFRSDTGLFQFKQLSQEISTLGTYTTSMMMGSVGSSSGFGQLSWYASEDGPSNGSYHLGLAKSSASLAYNLDPQCAATVVFPKPSASCAQAGQLVYDPNGYAGGVALGVGQGASYNTGLAVDANALAHAPNGIDAPATTTDTIGPHTAGGNITSSAPISAPQFTAGNALTTAAATFKTSSQIVGGQGSVYGWNLNAGDAATDFINVDPGNYPGGFKFWDTYTGNSAVSGQLVAQFTRTQSGSSAPFAPGSYTKANLPSAPADGSEAYCSDCKLNSITGVRAVYHASNQSWTDSMNNALSN